MEVSRVLVSLKGSDVLSIINDFVKVEGLNLDYVEINNEVLIKGSYKKVLKINFEGAISNIEVNNNNIICNFSKFKVYKLGMIRMIRSLALKIGLNFLDVKGITANKNKLEVNVDELLKDLKFINLNVEDIDIKEETIEAKVNNLKLNLGLILNKEDKNNDEKIIKEEITESVAGTEVTDIVVIEDSKEEIEERVLDEFEEEALNLTRALRNQKERNDFYDKGREKAREKVKDNLPKNAKAYSDYIFIVPDLLALILRLLKDDRVNIKTKLAVSASIAYIVCPNDLIPSNIPLVGKVDDIAVLFFALNRIATDVPMNVIIENWSGKNEMILVLKNGLEYVANFTGARNVDKIYKIIEELSVL
ncbi:YkvA family protein [Clostridium chrysemydis]|uniref:YkvA family protein n=1 Tax=Clostridium chrysemydis TaxID=2665504 RepID=UPI001883CFB0|nr:DUF1232 domain-containing protein [Clostridium chrysemydis]